MSVSVATWVTPHTEVPHVAAVVTVTAVLGAELLPAASRAVTAYRYGRAAGQAAVDERRVGRHGGGARDRADLGAVAVDVVGAHADVVGGGRPVRVTVVPDAEPLRPVGVVGAVVSVWQAGGVMETGVLPCETLPAASRDWT